MSAKISASRRRAFLKALAATGNQTLAAERAKVSRSWVQLHRSGDPEFDAACREAIAVARERLSGAPDRGGGEGRSNRPGARWRYFEGEELVVKGTGGSGQEKGRRVQIARARVKQWTPRAEARFLSALGATCNVKAACAEAGLTQASAYNHRNRWQGFAKAWDAALDLGSLKLDCAIIEAARNIFSDDEAVEEDRPIPHMSFDQAISALWLHQRRLWGIGRAPGRVRTREPDIEEVRAEVLRKVETMVRAQGLKAAGGRKTDGR